MTSLVTGANGFIGRHLLQALRQAGEPALAMLRTGRTDRLTRIADLADANTLPAACAGVETVYHCAGYAHAFASLGEADAARHHQINFLATRDLVQAAGAAGVRRFVLLSSIKAMAEPGEVCADEEHPGRPETAYGLAKRAAEAAVLAAGDQYGMHVVNLRLAMVYGHGSRGNLERMGRLIQRGWFPPLPETGNRRSLVHVADVVAAMRRVAADDRARGRTYIVASPEAPSGRQLYDAMRSVLGLSRVRWAVPEWSLRLAAQVGDQVGQLCRRRMPLDSEALDRLLGSACYSAARINRELGWCAGVSLIDGLGELFGNEAHF